MSFIAELQSQFHLQCDHILDLFHADFQLDEVRLGGKDPSTLTLQYGQSRKAHPSPLFNDHSAIELFAQSLALTTHTRLDHLTPCNGGIWLKGPLRLRWQAVLSKLANPGPQVILRRCRFDKISLSDYLDPHNLLPHVLNHIRSGHPLLICGASASGKSTLLSLLLKETCPERRTLILENHPELYFDGDEVLSLRTLEAVRDMPTLVQDALRLSAQSIVMGELLGPDIAAFFDLTATGHFACMATFHATSLHSALWRIKHHTHLEAEQLREQNLAFLFVELSIKEQVQLERPVFKLRCFGICPKNDAFISGSSCQTTTPSLS